MNLRRAKFAFATLAMGLGAAAVSCASTGSPLGPDDDAGGQPEAAVDTSLPQAFDAGVDSTVRETGSIDASAMDAQDAASADGSPEAGDGPIADSAPDVVAETGSPCPSANATQIEPCGVCGTQTHTCGGSPLVWGPWSACSGEVAGGCVPGTTQTGACGLCGTATLVCQADCEYAVSACTGQVANGCVAGSTDFEPDPTCSDAGVKGKSRSCSSQCAWSAYSACQAPPTSLTIAPDPHGVVDTIVDLLGTVTTTVLTTGTCPTTLNTGTVTSYAYVKVSNATSKSAVVSIWTSQTASGPSIDTLITTYPGAAPPSTGAARMACTNTVTDFCFDNSDPTSCLGSFGGLMIGGGNAVTLAAGASLTVYVAAALATDTGPIRLSARTESLQ